MEKPFKVEDGKVIVELHQKLDLDKDGIPSVEAIEIIKLSAYELINEIAKKDLPMIELILKQVKA